MYPHPFHLKPFLFDFLLSIVTLLFGAMVATPILFILQNEARWSCSICVTLMVSVTVFYFLRARFSILTTAFQILLTLACLLVAVFSYIQEMHLFPDYVEGKGYLLVLVLLVFTFMKHLSDAIILRTSENEG
jgi:hypothetical protein